MRGILIVIALLVITGIVWAGDFKIQRGVTSIATATTAVTITAGVDYTAPADINRAFIRLVTTKNSGSGHDSGGGTQGPGVYSAYIADGNNLLTSVTFTRNIVSAANTRIQWEIIEYVGPTGGPNEIR
ncbi:MAG: hypothetical protein AABY11_03330, partial [archaeon]